MTPVGLVAGRGFLCKFDSRPGRWVKIKFTMTKLKNLLHCYAMGMGIKGISSAFHLSRNTVRKYVRLFQESGIPMVEKPGGRDPRFFQHITRP